MRTRLLPLIGILLTLAVLAGLHARPFPPLEHPPSDTRVVFLVRHADTPEDAARDPELTDAGHARAAELARTLIAEPLAAVYVTATNRSHQTAAGLAVEPTEYAPMDADALAIEIQKHPVNSSVLVVAHSNTLPLILAALGGPIIDDLPHDAFDRLYAVVMQDGEHVRTLKLRY